MAIELPPPEAAPVEQVSARSSFISLVLVVVSVGLATAGHLTLKAAMNSIGRIGTEQVSAALDTITRAAREPKLWLGLFFFGLSAAFWLVVLSRVPLSLAYPFAGLSYIVIVALDATILNETVPGIRWVGAAIIAVGIAIIGFSSRTLQG